VEICIRPVALLPNRSILWCFFTLPALLKKYRPNLLWYPFMQIAPKTATPTLLSMHDVVHKEFSATMGTRLRIKQALGLMDRIVNRVDKIWVNSRYTAQKTAQYYPHRKCKEMVVGLSVNTDLYRPIVLDEPTKSALLRKVGVNADKKILLSVGSLEPRKNLAFLLSLMPTLASKGYELVVVSGKGLVKTNIAGIVNADGYPRQSEHFAGYLADEELVQLYNAAHCYVSTALNEGFGMSQLEAMYCGVPVVTADNSAMTEVVGGAGILVQGWDSAEWVRQIEYAATHPTEITARYPAKLAEYRWEAIIHRIAEYIEKPNPSNTS
jgi:glycosyltransferase involved in cell wall biosynthesis